MHELSIVSSVLEQLDELKKQHEGARFSKVGLRVGELAGVDVDCLRFGFECVVKDTNWESLALEIEQIRGGNDVPGAARNSGRRTGPRLVLSAARPQPSPSLEKSFRSHTSRWKNEPDHG